jgi:hypothetical protein
VTFQRERLANIARELPALFTRHHDELAVDKAKAPLDFDWEMYLNLDLLGTLQIVTVRDGKLLVGYVFNVIRPHPHKKSTRFCIVDMYWLHPAYRVGLIGLKLFRLNEEFLKAAKVKKITVGEKLHFHNEGDRRVALLFKRLGYKPEDLYYGKWIGG